MEGAGNWLPVGLNAPAGLAVGSGDAQIDDFGVPRPGSPLIGAAPAEPTIRARLGMGPHQPSGVAWPGGVRSDIGAVSSERTR